MGLWKLFGGEINHKAIEKDQKWKQDILNLEMENTCTAIMLRGMPEALNFKSEEKIKFVLKKFPDCPKIPNNWGHIKWGKSESDINNWKNGQQWLKDKEKPELLEKNAKNQKNIEEMIKWIKALEEEISVLKEKISKYENNNK